MKEPLARSFATAALVLLTTFNITAKSAAPSVAPLMAARAQSSSTIPAWVSARAAFKSDGELRAELFGRVPLSMLNENRRQNDSDCRVYLGSPPLDDFAAKDSFEGLVSSALTIIEGRVVSTDPGFLNGVPGILVTLNVSQTYKSFGQLATAGEIHVFVGEAKIPTRSGLICSKTFSKIPPPQPGDKVVAFSSVDTFDAEHRILVVDERKQLVVEREGHLYAPVALSESDRSTFADLKELGTHLLQSTHLHDVPRRFVQ